MAQNRKNDITDRGAFSQTVLILESVFILLLGVLTGVLLPDEIISKAQKLISDSLLNYQPGHFKYAVLLLAAFIIFHQHFCWMWLVRNSNRVFSKKNWGEICFIYTCVGLFLFSVCFGISQIFLA